MNIEPATSQLELAYPLFCKSTDVIKVGLSLQHMLGVWYLFPSLRLFEAKRVTHNRHISEFRAFLEFQARHKLYLYKKEER